jgi:DNA helicase-2/ATP-dependent DNA helicase PcrA
MAARKPKLQVAPTYVETEPAPRAYVASPQQQAYFDWVETGRGSAFLEAVAGAGKTTTLVKGCSQIISSAKSRISVAAAMYNKKNATDFQNKLAEAEITPMQVRAGTFHSFGFAAWRYVHKNVQVDDRIKRDRLANTLTVPRHLETFTFNLVSLAKQAGIGAIADASNLQHWWDIVEHHDLDLELENAEDTKEGIRWAYKVLKTSRDIAHEIIDFDDMIYMPIATNCRVWQNDWVLVDEAQDTNPARRALAKKMLKPGGRAVFVGDRHQAIYGFTGADNDAVDVIIREFGCCELPLTTTYRCPKAVVKKAQEVVSHIVAHETAPEGVVRQIDLGELQAQCLRASDAILCRNTAPLVSLAYTLIKAGTACHVEGKSIGEGLKKLIGRWKTNNIAVFRDAVTNWREKRVSKLMKEGKEAMADKVNDQVDTVLAIADGCADVETLRSKIDTLFQDDTPTLTLSTVHKAKGREWDRVFVLGANLYMPSKYARQDWQLQQEDNLVYVAYTRSKAELVSIWVSA